MTNIKFVLNRAGVAELLKSKKMEDVLEAEARKIRNRCGEGYGIATGQTSQRAKATVGTRSIRGQRDNLKNNTLLKALG